MPCERVEQPLSHSALEDTGAPAPMEIMMAGSPEDICLLACSPQSPGTRGDPGAATSRGGARATGTRGVSGATPSWEWGPKLRGHMAAPELP
jgi:hypothetical protein